MVGKERVKTREREISQVTEEPGSQLVHGLVGLCKVFGFHCDAFGELWEGKWALDRAAPRVPGEARARGTKHRRSKCR